MKNKNETFKKLRDFNIRDTRKFILNTKETIYLPINSDSIDRLCGFEFNAKNHFKRKEKINKKEDKIYKSEGLYKFSLVRKTNYFALANLLFVVFSPDFNEFYADFIFKEQNGSLIALRTILPNTDQDYAINDTKVVLSDIYNVTDFDELLCEKTVAYPIEAYSKNISRKYGKRYQKETEALLSNFSLAYGSSFDVSKQTRVRNFSKDSVKKI